MAGEMLQVGDHACRPVSSHRGSSKESNLVRILAIGANAYYRIDGVVVYVHYRRQVHVDAKRLEFAACGLCHIVDHLLRAGSSQRHAARKLRCALSKALYHAVLLVDGDE